MWILILNMSTQYSTVYTVEHRHVFWKEPTKNANRQNLQTSELQIMGTACTSAVNNILAAFVLKTQAVKERDTGHLGGWLAPILRQRVETGVLFRSCLMLSDAGTKSCLTPGLTQRRPVGAWGTEHSAVTFFVLSFLCRWVLRSANSDSPASNYNGCFSPGPKRDAPLSEDERNGEGLWM